MKKTATLLLLSLSLFAAGCSNQTTTPVGQNAASAESGNPSIEMKSEQSISQAVSDNDLEKLAQVQEGGNVSDCNQFKEQNIKEQCRATIQLNKKQ